MKIRSSYLEIILLNISLFKIMENLYKTTSFKTITLLTVFALFAAMFSMLLVVRSEAAGVAISDDVSSVTTVSTVTDVTFSWTASAAVEASVFTYSVVITPAMDAAVADCTAATVFIDTNGTDGAGTLGSFTSSGAVFTSTSDTASTGRELCLKLPANATQESFSISIMASTGDYGAALIHNDDNNDVLVTASVVPTLSFNIRNTADSADENTCAIGAVTTATLPVSDGNGTDPGECAYGLAIGTNSKSGFTATINAAAAFSSGTHSMVDLAVDDTAWAAGTEVYAIGYVSPAQTGSDGAGSFTTTLGVSGDFGPDTTAVPTSATPIIAHTDAIEYVEGSGATDLTIVEHGATISSGTPAGFYSQSIEYLVTASF